MTKLTVKALSEDIGTPVDRLLQQFSDAGINKKDGDSVSEGEKQSLLIHLKKSMVALMKVLHQPVSLFNAKLVAR